MENNTNTYEVPLVSNLSAEPFILPIMAITGVATAVVSAVAATAVSKAIG